MSKEQELADFEFRVQEIGRAANLITNVLLAEDVSVAAGLLAMRAILNDYELNNPKEFRMLDILEHQLGAMGIAIASDRKPIADKDKN